jgi:hypothetical protein
MFRNFIELQFVGKDSDCRLCCSYDDTCRLATTLRVNASGSVMATVSSFILAMTSNEMCVKLRPLTF